MPSASLSVALGFKSNSPRGKWSRAHLASPQCMMAQLACHFSPVAGLCSSGRRSRTWRCMMNLAPLHGRCFAGVPELSSVQRHGAARDMDPRRRELRAAFHKFAP